MAVVQLNGRALQFATTEVKSHADIVLAAVLNYGPAFQFAYTVLKLNPFLVIMMHFHI